MIEEVLGVRCEVLSPASRVSSLRSLLTADFTPQTLGGTPTGGRQLRKTKPNLGKLGHLGMMRGNLALQNMENRPNLAQAGPGASRPGGRWQGVRLCKTKQNLGKLEHLGGRSGGVWGTRRVVQTNPIWRDARCGPSLGPARVGCTNKPNSARSRRGSPHKQTQFRPLCRSGDRRSREGKSCETNPIPGEVAGKGRPIAQKKPNFGQPSPLYKQDAHDKSRDRPSRSWVLAQKRGSNRRVRTFVVRVKQSQFPGRAGRSAGTNKPNFAGRPGPEQQNVRNKPKLGRAGACGQRPSSCAGRPGREVERAKQSQFPPAQEVHHRGTEITEVALDSLVDMCTTAGSVYSEPLW
jgi:hypothetical protein